MNTATIQPTSRLNLLYLLAVGVVLPACLATANHLLLTSKYLSSPGPVSLCLLMGIYVLQIGFIGWAVATYIQPWPIRWVIYGWIMVLVDLQLAAMMSNGGEGVSCLATAIVTGQLGMVIVWGILGTGHWIWRVPALLVLLLQYWAFFNLLVRINHQPPETLTGSWDSLLTTQAVLLSVIGGILRLRGYSLAKLAPVDETVRSEESARTPIQFGIWDLLVWTTTLSILLGIAKAGDLLTLRFLKQIYDPGLLLLFVIGVCTALMLIVSLWSALGRGHPAIRYLVLPVLSLWLGEPIRWYCSVVARRTAATAWNYSYSDWYSTGYWWIGWMFFSGALLAASLLIYRTLGYRLVRSAKRSKGTSAAVTALPD